MIKYLFSRSFQLGPTSDLPLVEIESDVTRPAPGLCRIILPSKTREIIARSPVHRMKNVRRSFGFNCSVDCVCCSTHMGGEI